MTPQLNLRLGYRAAMDAEDFLVAPHNADAVAWIDRWPGWPAPALVLHGPSGCGKTHLAQVWRGRARALLWAASEVPSGDPLPKLAGANAVAVDGADAGVDEPGLLHLYNLLAERGGTLLLTASSPPSRWHIRLPDLRSRLLAAAVAEIVRPDEAFLAALIVKLFADRQIQVRQDVVDFLAVRLERSFAAVSRAVDEIDSAALAERRPITVPFVRSLSLLAADGSGQAGGTR